MAQAFNFQGSAALGILSFLGACFALGVAAVAILFLLLIHRKKPAAQVLVASAAGVGLYLFLLLAYAATSKEQVLDLLAEKYFCEVDCHLAYSVTNVARSRTVGVPPNRRTARGIYHLATVKTRFDEQTISSRRAKDAPLSPNPRSVLVVDDEGRRFEPVATGGTPLTQILRPGESYTTELVFDLPSDVKNPRLLITESLWVTRLLIGHENSFAHKKTSFRLSRTDSRAQ